MYKLYTTFSAWWSTKLEHITHMINHHSRQLGYMACNSSSLRIEA